MTLPVRLLGLLLTSVGLVVATTGLVLIVQPGDGDPPVAMEIPDRTPQPDATLPAPEGSPDPAPSPPPSVGPTPTAPPTEAPTPQSPSPTAEPDTTSQPEPRSVVPAGSDQTSPPTVVTPVAQPVAGEPTPITEPVPDPDPDPTPEPDPQPEPTPTPTPLTPAPVPGSDDEPRRTASCHDVWPWGERKGNHGKGQGWGPPVPCDEPGARGSRRGAGR